MNNRIYRHNRLISHARLKLTLILLALLCVGYAVKADTSCHLAIEVQQNTIDSLQHQLSIATSQPFNQGYQAGYKQATVDANPLYKQFLEIMGCTLIALIIAVFILAYLHKKNNP